MCPFVSADVRGGGRLRDEPKECLRRRLVVRVKDCRYGTPGSSRPRATVLFSVVVFFFPFKIEETCTLTTFVEQKLSICVNKLRNFM